MPPVRDAYLGTVSGATTSKTGVFFANGAMVPQKLRQRAYPDNR